ncbi:hCG1737663 [Homo sapiens]|uniref:Proline-rich protein, Y-linked n=1 Tax=Homo sapiens TaxID=9606 RepID=PRORY_HUMAN|nr:RecName: Full=Proline-rich protein, Y-linked [Homo sapiens]EAX11709.1 hCG1737663 [Homo sapiens]BAB15461.1 unnamed protein product [Homo sapiens]|eukprot:NP_001269400.1 proline-rich protein, Y-linked [Homo sapiens]
MMRRSPSGLKSPRVSQGRKPRDPESLLFLRCCLGSEPHNLSSLLSPEAGQEPLPKLLPQPLAGHAAWGIHGVPTSLLLAGECWGQGMAVPADPPPASPYRTSPRPPPGPLPRYRPQQHLLLPLGRLHALCPGCPLQQSLQFERGTLSAPRLWSWMKLETIILSKLSQGQKTKHRMFSLISES